MQYYKIHCLPGILSCIILRTLSEHRLHENSEKQLVESEKTKLSMLSLACRTSPLPSLNFSLSSPFLSLVIVKQGVVLPNNSFHINIVLPAYLLFYAGAKHCY